jgi:hypothetical protein
MAAVIAAVSLRVQAQSTVDPWYLNLTTERVLRPSTPAPQTRTQHLSFAHLVKQIPKQ